ncbi:aspartate--tRNA ligase [Candidatus Gottesmanbacteria bacterium]|nr:aspartate--tRNA ligase [Candidatus Gottesmanbacteria bacterium]
MRTLAIETAEKIGEIVTLQGWVLARRDHGKIMFLDLRDRSGVVQMVGTKALGDARAEDVVEVTGLVKKRPDSMVNAKIPTGSVEVEIQAITVISKAHEMPFPIDTDGYEVNEEIRTKYRYLDLRRPRMARNIRIRSKVVGFIRNYLFDRDFVEIETPILTKTTPEGARDFLVPSRLQQGKFYALPQSPQQYKQMLMVAGMERYFQIARCFRDEDPRKDRAYGEFTQLDMELSFVTQNDILTLIEEMFTKLVGELFPEKHISQSPWPRLAHKDVMAKYGTDKPDLRKDKNDPNELAFSWTIDFPLFNEQKEDDFFFGSGGAKFAPSHHMFTAPHPEDIPLLDTDPMKVRGLQHDLVLNGFEVGGGSIRIHQADVQNKVFDLIGFSEAQKQEFAHMLTAFTYGVPPHGGIAPGIDRFLMTVLGEPSVREVMAFPTSSSGTTSVMEAPSPATADQLSELGIAVDAPKDARPADGDAVYAQIVAGLEEKKMAFENYEHAPVKTSEEAAAVRNTPLHEGAKALVLYADNKPVMVVVAGDRKLDMKAFKTLYKIKDLRMGTPEEVTAVTRVTIGAVPPFGHLFNIPLYMDASLRNNTHVSFNAGLHTRSIRMKAADYEVVAKPTVGEFSK